MDPSPSPETLAAAAATEWFIARHKQKVGPFSLTQLQQQAAGGQLRPKDMVLAKNSGKWMHAEDVPGLHRAAFNSPGAPSSTGVVSAETLNYTSTAAPDGNQEPA